MHLADELLALGGAFLAAGLFARAGRRVGLPTIPLFMLAGLLLGPYTPGIALVEDPSDFGLLSSLGLILLLFYLGLEFHLNDLIQGGPEAGLGRPALPGDQCRAGGSASASRSAGAAVKR